MKKAFALAFLPLLVSGADIYHVLFQSHHQLPLGVDTLSPPTPTSQVALQAKPTTVYRPRSLDALHQARFRSLHHAQSEPVDWDAVEILGPDVEHKHTLAQLARMAGNAYALPKRKNWYDLDETWNKSFPFGWEEDDGFRGHVFQSSDNATVVLSIKGTTVTGSTSKKDKLNDNLLFSCCCARMGFTWIFHTVCKCYGRHNQCDSQCLAEALADDSLFYNTGVKLVDELRHMYPSANIWLVGHSLGGALASLLGATYGLPAVAFESPGERLAAGRLNLPLPPSPLSDLDGDDAPHPPVAVTHIYHTADPIPQGECSGFGSLCSRLGYAMETKCHLGKSIVFDTVEKLGWKKDAIGRHSIKNIIHDILEQDDVEWEEGRDVPLPRAEINCTDCENWEFGDFKN